MLQAANAGFLLGGSLIVAIGAQNAFVMRQGVLKAHLFRACLFRSIDAKALGPWLGQPRVWRVIDFCIAAVMLLLACKLLMG